MELCSSGIKCPEDNNCRLIRNAGSLLRLMLIAETEVVEEMRRKNRSLKYLYFIFVDGKIGCPLRKIKAADPRIPLPLVFEFIDERQSVIGAQVELEAAEKPGVVFGDAHIVHDQAGWCVRVDDAVVVAREITARHEEAHAPAQRPVEFSLGNFALGVRFHLREGIAGIKDGVSCQKGDIAVKVLGIAFPREDFDAAASRPGEFGWI